jgi:hypothetical protein
MPVLGISGLKLNKYKTNDHRPDLWMDLSNGRLDLYHRTSARDYGFRSVPLSLTMRRDHLGADEIQRALNNSARGHVADQFDLNEFHRFLSLMTGEDEILVLLWRCFFQARKNEILSDWDGGTVVALIPTAWAPQISAALATGFSMVFGRGLNLCTVAAAAPFSALINLQGKINTWSIGHQEELIVKVAEDQNCQRSEKYAFRIIKKCSNQLLVKMKRWNRSKPEEGLIAEISNDSPKIICAGQAYNHLLSWLDEPEVPRVDLAMDLCIGIISADGGFLPIRQPDDPACHWLGRRLQLTKKQKVSVSLAASSADVEERNGELFPMAHITKNLGSYNRPEITILLRRFNYARLAVRLTGGKDRRKKLMETQVRLPRLYQ